MKTACHNAVSGVERLLYAVPVVGINIYIEYTSVEPMRMSLSTNSELWRTSEIRECQEQCLV